MKIQILSYDAEPFEKKVDPDQATRFRNATLKAVMEHKSVNYLFDDGEFVAYAPGDVNHIFVRL